MINKLGIFGGTFDPIHYGHLQAVEAVSRQLELEQVLFVPAYIAPHKQGLQCAPAVDRLAMTRLAVAECHRYSVSAMEIERSGVSYTVETLRELKQQYPEKRLYFLIGADSLAQLPTWHNIEEQLSLAIFVAAGRPGYHETLRQVYRELGPAAEGRIILLATPIYDISSTEIRERVQAGLSLADLVPPTVEQYIRLHGLYSG